MFKNLKKLAAYVCIFAITITCTGYGSNDYLAERAAKTVGYGNAAKILGKSNVKLVSVKSKHTGYAEGYGRYCQITMEVE